MASLQTTIISGNLDVTQDIGSSAVGTPNCYNENLYTRIDGIMYLITQHSSGTSGSAGSGGSSGSGGTSGTDGTGGTSGVNGAQGPQGPQGNQGVPGTKEAIVESTEKGDYVSLYCTEMPEVRFDDIIKIKVRNRRNIAVVIDPLYSHVCEPNSIEAISYVTSYPICCGLIVKKDILNIEFEPNVEIPEYILVKLSGIRKGCANIRFQRRTKEQMIANNNFWNGWKK